MNDIHLQNLKMLHLLWLLPGLIGLLLFAARQRQRALEKFIRHGLLDRVTARASRSRRIWKGFFLLLAVAFIIMALTRPAWNLTETTVKTRGRDVVFVLDVSKSMLAEDLKPNRLERAKLAITDCIEQLQGDRVSLVVFAGTAAVKCPLTLDAGFFRLMLEQIDTNSINRGGTMLGDAIRTVIDQVFDHQERQYRDIILITDGEDHESFPVEAAKEAGELGVRLIIVGLGDEGEGQRIPVTDEQGRKTFLKYDGQEVWTKLDADSLREMANSTPGGRYLPVATGAIDLGAVYRDLVRGAAKKELETRSLSRYEEKFQIFLAVALLLLGLEMIVPEGRKAGAKETTGVTR